MRVGILLVVSGRLVRRCARADRRHIGAPEDQLLGGRSSTRVGAAARVGYELLLLPTLLLRVALLLRRLWGPRG